MAIDDLDERIQRATQGDRGAKHMVTTPFSG
jgi:hypothetical protein